MQRSAVAGPRRTEDVVSLESVGKTYGLREHTVAALSDVTIGFPAGTFTAIMGPSGSGKSTLLQCAAGLDRPTSGRIMLAGTDLTTANETQLTMLRRDRIGFVFQTLNLVTALTAAQNIGLPLRLAGRKPTRAEIDTALEAVGLRGRGNHRPSELSGGQQQRVAIARALITRPAVLFADEPTGALDTQSARDVLALLSGLVGRQRQTVIMVTHDPVAAAYAQRVIFLADGRLVGELTSPTAEAVAARMTGLERGW